MTSVVFLLSKDPVVEHGGDVALSRLFVELAAERLDVSIICLAAESGSVTADFVPGGVEVTRVRKPAVRPLSLLAGAAKTRRSLVHVRFDGDELVAAIERADADVYVAEHSYMAESFLRSSLFGTRTLVVDTHVSEALVWGASRGLLGRVEARRLVRDELRVAMAADAVGTFDADEAEQYRRNGVRGARWFELTLPPAEPVDTSSTPPRLVLMGTRDWPPNQEAFLHALKLWPRISAGIPDAELCIIGAKKPNAPEPPHPPGVRDLGFVDDLHAFLGTCRAMVAPIKTGGGVRVKILDAARIGLPVVGTKAAVGSLGELFGLDVFDDDDAFVGECRRMLTDRAAAAAAGHAIHRANAEHWRSGRVRDAVDALILSGQRPS
ncbi:glycosyltransferase [Mycolicibacterium sp. P1-18]|uniref:glycosyltransferase n=1 Tax=Mycolicibacterium sp. P1-18 TaxID=2024615 RepID=UPI0011F2EAC1|nr:glycosyltransferase [Mycolicibacterium sp. P1-18]KAA0098105.1 glycosyltransferase [Mycolicibacterium sp. P1-18]